MNYYHDPRPEAEREAQHEQPVTVGESVAEEPPAVEEKFEDVLDEEPLTFERGREILVETGDRLRDAGWRPFRQMVGSYVSKVVDAAKGLADGFEGKQRRGD